MDKNTFEKRVLEECENKQNIFIFVSKDDEVDTRPIIKRLLELKRNVIVPVCHVPENKIIPSRIKSIDELVFSSYGILEPKKVVIFPKERIDIFFVPGTKFDNKGNRRGRGGGYFDRFLEDVRGKKLIIGICYEDQIVDKMETNKWDIPVDKIIACRK